MADIFLSYKTLDGTGHPTADTLLAREVFERLSQLGLEVFFSQVSLERLGISAYKAAIDQALDQAKVLIAIGTSAEHLASEWVRYEWDSFYNDIISGIKPNGRVFVYVDNVSSAALPRALRQSQVFLRSDSGLERLARYVANAVGTPTDAAEPSDPVRSLQDPSAPKKDDTDSDRLDGQTVAEESLRLIRMRAIVEKYSKLITDDDLEFLEAINPEKLNNALSIWAPDARDKDDTPLCLYDNTSLDTAKSGCLITNVAIYFRNDFGKPGVIKLVDVKSAIAAGVGPWKTLRINGSANIDFVLLPGKALAQLALMVSELSKNLKD